MKVILLVAVLAATTAVDANNSGARHLFGQY